MADGVHTNPTGIDTASHTGWNFRHEAFVWHNKRPTAINFHPFAFDYYSWLKREGKVTIFTDEHKNAPNSYTNPFTYKASTIGIALTSIVNQSHGLATGSDSMDPVEFEIERVRIHSEQILYIARFCETLIKQLLFCTTFPKKYYTKASMNKLLSTECLSCKGSGSEPHNISLLGSLAHRYHLCHEFDGCLIENLSMAGTRRNKSSAHSDTLKIENRSLSESRKALFADSLEVGNHFVHMLRHLKDLELRMTQELEQIFADHYATESMMITLKPLSRCD